MTDLPSAGMTITQDARALTVAAPGAGRADSKTFLLDGSKSSNAWGRGGIGVSTARWDGPVLVVTTQGSTLQWINRYSLVGDQLHIEMSGSGSSAVIAYKRVP